ncbi:hypothetical protein N8157_03250 [Burkholderiales bacterium]|nr:hypothetical protein [Burkholderiales bacterium]
MPLEGASGEAMMTDTWLLSDFRSSPVPIKGLGLDDCCVDINKEGIAHENAH